MEEKSFLEDFKLGQCEHLNEIINKAMNDTKYGLEVLDCLADLIREKEKLLKLEPQINEVEYIEGEE